MKKSTIMLLILIGILIVFAVTGLLVFRSPLDRMIREYRQAAVGGPARIDKPLGEFQSGHPVYSLLDKTAFVQVLEVYVTQIGDRKCRECQDFRT